MTEPPRGVTGPINLPIFSLAKTSGKILPENINVPAAIARLGNANLPRPEENLGCREMARRETPLKMRYCEAVDHDWRENWERSGYRFFNAWEPNARRNRKSSASF